MRALHAVVNSVVALLLASVAMVTTVAKAQTTTENTADTQASSNVNAGNRKLRIWHRPLKRSRYTYR